MRGRVLICFLASAPTSDRLGFMIANAWFWVGASVVTALASFVILFCLVLILFSIWAMAMAAGSDEKGWAETRSAAIWETLCKVWVPATTLILIAAGSASFTIYLASTS